MISDDTASYTKIPFTEEEVKEYLDKCIKYWRKCPPTEMQTHYVDAYQSVRVSLFGELLPKEEVIRSCKMLMAELRQNTLEFVTKMLPDAGEIDIKTATEKIVKNLAYLTEDGDLVRSFGGRGDLRLPRPRRG